MSPAERQNQLKKAARLRDSARKIALEGLTPVMSDASLREAFMLACSIDSKYQRSTPLHDASLRLLDEPTPKLFEYWKAAWPLLSSRPRPELLADIQEMSQLVAFLAKPEGFQVVVDAIDDVGRWWP